MKIGLEVQLNVLYTVGCTKVQKIKYDSKCKR